MNVLEEIKEKLYDELECIAAEEQMTKTSLDIIDKLTHSIKSIETVLAMEDYDDGYSQRYNSRYDDGYSYRSNGGRSSYRGSRNMNNGGRNGMSYNDGRYYRGRYSREDSKEKMLEKLEEYMNDTESDKVKDSIRKVINQIEHED